mgnify:CR=1 FL=1
MPAFVRAIISQCLGAWLVSCGLSGNLHAEGTAQLIPPGSAASCVSYLQGNDGPGKEGPNFGRPWYDRIYVHVADPSTEVIYYGFTRLEPVSQPLYYRILDPDGNVLRAGRVAESAADSGYIADNGVAAYAGPKAIAGGTGYDALTCTPTVAGDYAIVFNVGHDATPTSGTRYFVHPFDVTVAEAAGPGKPDPIDGRLFSYKWHLNTNSSSHEACMQFYTWTPDSLVVMMDMNEIRPYGYTVSFNSYGATNTGDIEADRRSSTTVSDAVPEYRVFLQAPDPQVYPTGTPGRITYLDIEGCHADSSFCIEVNATKRGEINVYIDLNGNGVYEEGTVDRYFPFNNGEVGTICVPWDGLDGLGNPVGPGSNGTVTVEFLAGEVHYPVYDPENHPQGFRCAMIRPSGFAPKMYYDNRSTPIGTHNLDGCDSLCNTWTGKVGDRVMVNTWLNTITSTDTDSFYLTDVCPPVARDDSTCTTPGASLSYPVLANDQPGDYALNPGSGRIVRLSDSLGTAEYLAADQALRYTPAESSPAKVRIDYEICDSTPGSLSGPLCDQAQVWVTLDPQCEGAQVLSALRWQVSVQRQRRDAALRWETFGEAVPQQYVVERAGGRAASFRPLATRGACQARHRYVDLGVAATAWQQVRYRIRAELADGTTSYSPEVHLALPGQPSVAIEGWHEAEARRLTLRYLSPHPLQLYVLDRQGRQVGMLHLQAQPERATLHQLPTAGWTPGWYLVAAYEGDWQVWRQAFWIGP